VDATPGLLLLEAPNTSMDDDEDGSSSLSSLSSLPSDMEVDEAQH
jgi:hypothetical protein